MPLKVINDLDVTIARTGGDLTIKSVTIAGGKPDACGNRYLVDVSLSADGTYLIQTNFSDLFESRRDYKEAIGYAMYIATQLSEMDERSLTPDREIGWND